MFVYPIFLAHPFKTSDVITSMTPYEFVNFLITMLRYFHYFSFYPLINLTHTIKRYYLHTKLTKTPCTIFICRFYSTISLRYYGGLRLPRWKFYDEGSQTLQLFNKQRIDIMSLNTSLFDIYVFLILVLDKDLHE